MNSSQQSRIRILGEPKLDFPVTFSGATLLGSLGALHYLIEKRGQRDIILDFSKCKHVLESGMLPLIPILNKHVAKRKAKFQLRLPKDEKIQAQFSKCNWAHLIDPIHYVYDEAATATHCPALRYRNAEEQSQCVDKILSVVMKSTPLTRDVLKAIEWSLNEITDNVLNHAGATAGYVQATWFRENHVIEFVVADAGIGIPASLKETNHCLALERAIQEGVTRNKKTNQGNGLYGSYRIATIGQGQFSISSKFAHLSLTQSGEVKIRKTPVPYQGTTVRWNIRTDSSDLLKRALVFNGIDHDPPYDFIDKITDSDDGLVRVGMKAQFPSLGSRDAGSVVRTYIRNILNLESGSKIEFDFDQVNIISSSFADEVFGRLFVELGPLGFMTRIKFVNTERDILGLIDRAILQRSSQARGS